MRTRIALVTIMNVLSVSLLGHAQIQQTASTTPYVDPVGGLTSAQAPSAARETLLIP